MKQLSQYLYEQLDKGDRISTLLTFKDNMMRAKEIKEGFQNVFDATERDFNQDFYENIKFIEYWNDEFTPIKYLHNDQGVFTFEKFSNNTVYQYNQKVTKSFLEELDKQEIVQLSLPNVKGTIYMTIQPDSTANWLNIVFSNDEPKEFEQD